MTIICRMYCEMTRKGKRMYATDRDMIDLSHVFDCCNLEHQTRKRMLEWLKKKDMECVIRPPEQSGLLEPVECAQLGVLGEIQKYPKCKKALQRLCADLYAYLCPDPLVTQPSLKNADRNWVIEFILRTNINTLTFMKKKVDLNSHSYVASISNLPPSCSSAGHREILAGV